MVNREGTRKIFGTWMAAALLATALGCSGGGNDVLPAPSGMCNPVANPAPDPAAAQSFCAAMYGAICDRGFTDCVSEIGISGSFASAADCRTFMTSVACSGSFTSYGYDASCAASCVDVIQRGSCGIFTVPDEPQACAAALVAITPPPPPPPTCTATIGAGTITDTITSADPLYSGGYSHTFCIALAANQTIRIETLPPTSGTGIYDTVVYLLDPNGTVLGSDDDGSTTGLYSLLTRTVPAAGQYRIIVRGFSLSRVGSYQLSVTLY